MDAEVEATVEEAVGSGPRLTTHLGGDSGTPVPRAESIKMVKRILESQASYSSLGVGLSGNSLHRSRSRP